MQAQRFLKSRMMVKPVLLLEVRKAMPSSTFVAASVMTTRLFCNQAASKLSSCTWNAHVCMQDHSAHNAQAGQVSGCLCLPGSEACGRAVCTGEVPASRASSLGSREGLTGGRPCCMPRCERRSVLQLRHLQCQARTTIIAMNMMMTCKFCE